MNDNINLMLTIMKTFIKSSFLFLFCFVSLSVSAQLMSIKGERNPMIGVEYAYQIQGRFDILKPISWSANGGATIKTGQNYWIKIKWTRLGAGKVEARAFMIPFVPGQNIYMPTPVILNVNILPASNTTKSTNTTGIIMFDELIE